MSVILAAVGVDPNDPEVVAAQEDFHEFADVISELVRRSQALGLTIAEVASQMGTSQSFISSLESSSANPTVGLLQRYARAVGSRLLLDARPTVAVGSSVMQVAVFAPKS